ncbi:MAG: hypothetical protein Ct9H300mP13_1780 [Gammaproteobacteria bacterium]|nr:MAG: hypothetical protein Ct9H300mP13_1780 [Gammaproteobacteria bacterium]
MAYLRNCQKAIGIIPFVHHSRQAGLPVWSKQTQRIPTLSTPGIRNVGAFKHDVIDTSFIEAITHRQSCVTGADYNDINFPRCVRSHRQQTQLTSTVTFVGFVMMSYTADRFWIERQ